MNRLAVLGLDDTSEQLYRRVLRDQGRTAGVYAARLNAPQPDIERAAEALRARHLVRISEDGEIRADHPRAGLERILSSEEAQLATRRRELARLRDAIDGYAGDHRAGQEAAEAGPAPREYVDAAGLVGVMEHLAASTSGTVRVTHPDAPVHGPGAQPVLRSLVEDGRGLLGLYEFDGVQSRGLEVAEWAAVGEQQRLATQLPCEFVCYGTDVVLAATDWGRDGGQYVVLRDPVVIRAFVELFDRLWMTSVGVEEGVDASSERLVALMEAGLKDEAIARVLGVSLRTVRRRIAALMEECHVDTRFQLAVKLTERGLVHSGPSSERGHGGSLRNG